MNFLAPLFLFGAAAISLPVIFHMVRRSTRERMPFSSLLFLRTSPPRLARRNKLEQILLLVLRCAVILLLAAAFARPFLKHEMPTPPSQAAAKRTLVLLDTSASMRRAGIWDKAVRSVIDVLQEASPVDSVALYTFSLRLEPVMSFTDWGAAPIPERVSVARNKLREIRPGWGATRMADALMRAAEIAADPGDTKSPGKTRLVVVSDMQEGSRLGDLQGYNWPAGVSVSSIVVTGAARGNASLHLALDRDETADKRPGVRVRVRNETGSNAEQFKVGWKLGSSFAGSPVQLYVPAGQSRTVLVPFPPEGTKADRVELEGDAEGFDNAVFIEPPVPTVATVLYVGAEAEDDSSQPLYFLRRAFQDTRQQVVRVVASRPGQRPAPSTLDETSLFVVTDLLSEPEAKDLGAQVERGKALLLAPKTAAAGALLRAWLDAPDLSVEESTGANYALLGEINFRHPLFEAFADPRFSDFTKIHFWKHRRLLGVEEVQAARVLARFDDSQPALVEFPLGKGRIYFLASGWQPADSQLALSSKFVPLVYSMLQQNGAPVPPPTQYYPGDNLVLPVAASGVPLRLRHENGDEVPLTPGQAAVSERLSPGLYLAEAGNDRKRFAINVDPNESHTVALPGDELERLGAPVDTAPPPPAKLAARQQRLASAELENRQKLWRWLVLGTLVALLGETWLAGRATRIQNTPVKSHG